MNGIIKLVAHVAQLYFN